MIAMVSNISDSFRSFMAATAALCRSKLQHRCRGWRMAMSVALILGAEHSLTAQDAPTQPAAQQDDHFVANTVKFLAGGALGLGLHESRHVIFDVAFDAEP